MIAPEGEKLQDILYTDLGNKYVIERINKHIMRTCDQDISTDNLCKKAKIITVDYEDSQMLGFQFRKEQEQLQYRWFNFNTLSKNIYHGQWCAIF